MRTNCFSQRNKSSRCYKWTQYDEKGLCHNLWIQRYVTYRMSKNLPEISGRKIDSLFEIFGRKKFISLKFISLKTTGYTSILILNFVWLLTSVTEIWWFYTGQRKFWFSNFRIKQRIFTSFMGLSYSRSQYSRDLLMYINFS